MSDTFVTELDDSIQNSLNELLLSKKVGEHLNKHYPGHLWAVHVRGGVVMVQNLLLSGKWGFILKEKDLDPDLKMVMRAGGELLERYNVSRGRLSNASMANVKKSNTGLPVGDYS